MGIHENVHGMLDEKNGVKLDYVYWITCINICLQGLNNGNIMGYECGLMNV